MDNFVYQRINVKASEMQTFFILPGIPVYNKHCYCGFSNRRENLSQSRRK